MTVLAKFLVQGSSELAEDAWSKEVLRKRHDAALAKSRSAQISTGSKPIDGPQAGTGGRVALTVTIELDAMGLANVSNESLLEAIGHGLQTLRADNTGQADSEQAGTRTNLTAREVEVLGLLVAGHSNKETARKLGISPRTVEFHRANLQQKTGARSLPDLVRLNMGARPDAPDMQVVSARIGSTN